ncbi:YugN-like family protein [Lentibacillus halodurans]|uniref:YugN-like family protein n=1 Tax=Lentibacillus halodurans TaxID=237679 RepID=A0A1I0W5K4_9BACI|nr:YugN family protein [Lentibacillus halodurans]SFA83550.1 YugN-like family protein [Lentibacillus halodurans]
MLKLETGLEGKKAYFGDVYNIFRFNGYTLCGNWEYDRGMFDMVLCREGGETIYIRVPFHVLEGVLDSPKAHIEFGTPFVIKHVVNTGLDWDESSLLTTTGFNQFQDPVDKDGNIIDKSRWEAAGEQEIEKVVNSMGELKIS